MTGKKEVRLGKSVNGRSSAGKLGYAIVACLHRIMVIKSPYGNKGGMDAGVVALTDVKGFGTDKNMVLTDINADGMVDIGYFDNAAGSAVFRYSRSESVETTNKPLPFTFNLIPLPI